MARRNMIGEEEIKQMTVNALVDTGAYTLCINENIQEQLQLPLLEKRMGNMADGRIKEYDVVGPIELKFKNRRTMVNAMVLPGDNEVIRCYSFRRYGCFNSSATTGIDCQSRPSLFCTNEIKIGSLIHRNRRWSIRQHRFPYLFSFPLFKFLAYILS